MFFDIYLDWNLQCSTGLSKARYIGGRAEFPLYLCLVRLFSSNLNCIENPRRQRAGPITSFAVWDSISQAGLLMLTDLKDTPRIAQSEHNRSWKHTKIIDQTMSLLFVSEDLLRLICIMIGLSR